MNILKIEDENKTIIVFEGTEYEMEYVYNYGISITMYKNTTTERVQVGLCVNTNVHMNKHDSYRNAQIKKLFVKAEFMKSNEAKKKNYII